MKRLRCFIQHFSEHGNFELGKSDQKHHFSFTKLRNKHRKVKIFALRALQDKETLQTFSLIFDRPKCCINEKPLKKHWLEFSGSNCDAIKDEIVFPALNCDLPIVFDHKMHSNNTNPIIPNRGTHSSLYPGRVIFTWKRSYFVNTVRL